MGPSLALAVTAVILSADAVIEEQPLDRGLISVRYAPGISAPVSIDEKSFGVGPAAWVHSPGVEVRISRYFSIRADAEIRNGARTWQIPGIKLSAMPHARVHPWISLSVALHQVDSAPGRVSIGLMKAAGLDFTIFKYFFLSGEVRVSYVPGDCCGLPRVSGLFGGGVQFL